MNRFETSDGVAIAWQEWAGRGAGVPVILHHGFGVSAKLNWEMPGITRALTDAGHPVVVLDARGHGESDKPHDKACYGEARMARDLSELADHLELERFDLVGYSMGAIVALIAATQDERIRRLVVGGVGEGILVCGGVDTRVVDNHDLITALLTDDPSVITPAALPFRKLADATGADRQALAAQASVVHASPIALDRIKARTLVMAGDRDPLAANPERLAAAIDGARFGSVAGDHMAAVGSPAFTEMLLEFLA